MCSTAPTALDIATPTVPPTWHTRRQISPHPGCTGLICVGSRPMLGGVRCTTGRRQGRAADRQRVVDDAQAGFTLIEVMVVVLILGILMAIATPSLLGARERVWDLSARTSVRTALTTAIMLSEFRSDFTFASPAALAAAEPSLTYVDAGQASTGPKVVSVDASSPSLWVAVSRSNSGRCHAAIVGRLGQWSGVVEDCSARDVRRSPTTQIVGGAGSYVGEAPDGATVGADGTYESDDQIFAFDEGRFVLTSTLSLFGGVQLPAGTVVCSHLFLYSPISATGTTGQFDLGAPVLGSARTAGELWRTRSFGNPGTTYQDRGWEDTDVYAEDGSVVTLTMWALADNADMIRIFTACP